jgi:hypothetical protein
MPTRRTTGQVCRKDATYLAVVGAPLADTVRGRLDLGSAGGVELLFNGRVTAAVFALPAATLVEAIRHVQLAVSSPPPGHFAFASTRRLWFAAPHQEDVDALGLKMLMGEEYAGKGDGQR